MTGRIQPRLGIGIPTPAPDFFGDTGDVANGVSDKLVSTELLAALKGQPNGIAGLNGEAILPIPSLPRGARPTNPQDNGAWFDGTSHPISGESITGIAGFASLAAAQAAYPHVTALTNEWDWVATQKTLNEASGRRVTLPAGTGIFDQTVTHTSVGSLVQGQDYHGTKIRAKSGFSGSLWSLTAQRASIRDFQLDANGAATHCLIVDGAARAQISEMLFQGADSHNILFDDNANNNFAGMLRCFVLGAGGDGIHVALQANNNGLFFDHIRSEDNTGHGGTFRGEGFQIFAGHYEGNGGYGIKVADDADSSNTTKWKLINPWLENNTSGPVLVSAKATSGMFMPGESVGSGNITVNSGGNCVVLEYSATSGNPEVRVGVGGRTYIKLRPSLTSDVAVIETEGSGSNVDLRVRAKGAGLTCIGNPTNKLGFFGGSGAVKPTVSDATELLTALDAMGLVTYTP